MNRVKPSVLLLLLLSLPWVIGCDSDPDPDGSGGKAIPHDSLVNKLDFPPDWARVEGDKVIVTVGEKDSVLVIPSFYGEEAKDLEYVGSGALPEVQTSCDAATFGPRILGEGEWSLAPHFYRETCASTLRTVHPTPYAGTLHYTGERTLIFRFESPGMLPPADITYITIVMEGLDTGDTTDT
jgi:hypothetical protein